MDVGAADYADVAIDDPLADSTEESRAFAERCRAALAVTRSTLHDAESMLGDLDAIAGDGDHGRGMVRGIDAAYVAAADAVERGAGAASTLAAAGDAWGDRAGGTSGVLWGAGLRALGEALGDTERPSAEMIAAGVNAFADRLLGLGKAEPGDKTMMDAIVPFAESFGDGIRYPGG
jgi:dihydroxyacetone kinase